MIKALDNKNLQIQMWQRERRAIALLSSLNYRTGELSSYLHDIACGVSELLEVDWSVVTLCQQGFERVLASSIDMGEGEHIYSLHGSLTGTVIESGHSLVVEDANQHPEYGQAPEGYCAYLVFLPLCLSGLVVQKLIFYHKDTKKF